MSPIISVNGIGKRYQLGGSGPAHDTLRDLIASIFKGKSSEAAGNDEPSKKSEFWALNDVSFEVNEGEVVGIVGRNGAGKSTLLKILSQITTPTSGEAILNGRVGSLLEVGTGFHPELTGRENVFFNGTILGLRKHEIKARFDEIVAFSGVEEFIDTPIKRYSSGMKMRLAFSVAAHLEPEIMIIDEVLAVGDVDFQNKCLGKMRDVASAGRTVLFVSHNMSAVRQLCSRIIWLSGGSLQLDTNDVDDGLAQYTQAGITQADWRDRLPIVQEYFTVHDFLTFQGDPGNISTTFGDGDRVGVLIDVDVHRYVPQLNFGIQVHDGLGNALFYSLTTDGAHQNWPVTSEGRHRLVAYLPARVLNAGDYNIRLVASLHNERWLLDPEESEAGSRITIEFTGLESPYWRTRRPGLIGPQLDWQRI
jgi:lipopolysaccharide transport system ATP-binding protein